MTDELHDLYMDIAKELTTLANKMIVKAVLTAEEEDDIRELLNENIRFWKES
jgi:hypothetical protein